MKLSDYKNTYYEFSGKASDVARHLAFAGIALAWVFRNEGQGQTALLPGELFLPIVLLAATLAFDLLQYISATTIWGIFQWYHESRLDDPKDDPELDSPAWLKWPQMAFFVMKLLTIALAYFLLIKYVWSICFKDA